MEWTAAMELIFDELSRIFERSGKGSIRAAEEELAVYRGFFRNSRNRQRLDLPRLLQLLQTLKMEPGAFFCKAFEHNSETANPLLAFDQETRASEIYNDAEHELNTVLAAKTFETLGTLAPVHASHLQRYASRLFEDPLFIANRARQMVYEARMIKNLSLLLHGASLWASARIYSEELDLARVILHRAVKLARNHGHKEALANLLLRQSQLAIKLQEVPAGWCFALEAIKTFAYRGLPIGISHALVAAGLAKSLLDKPVEAEAHLNAALKFLPMEETEQPRSLIFLELARLAFLRHDLDTARARLEQAHTHLSDDSQHGRSRGFLLWIGARIAAREARPEEVERQYQLTYDYFALIPHFRIRVANEIKEYFAADAKDLKVAEKATQILSLAFDRQESPLPEFLISELVQDYF